MNARVIRRTLPLAVAFALIPAGDAFAAQAAGSLEYCTSGDECRYFPDPRLRVTFLAAPGERNSVTGARHAAGVRIRDASVPVTPGTNCRRVDDYEVDCGPPARAGMFVEVFAGDLDDTVSLAFSSRTLLGPGNDIGLGGPELDSALGEAGSDRLDGAGGGDLFEGGSGDDHLEGDEGEDSLNGDSGGDTLSGGSGPDDLEGGRGNDRLTGGSGNDRLVGGSGNDRFDAGSGNDSIDSADGRRERVRCGRGRDRVRADRRDRLSGCERRWFRR
jgi:hypothetical protein